MQIRITARYEETKGKVGVFTTPHISEEGKRNGHKFFIDKDALKYQKYNGNEEHRDHCDCVECCGIVELKKGYGYDLTIGCSHFKTKKQSALYLNKVRTCRTQNNLKLITTTMSVLVTEVHPMKIDDQTIITRIKVTAFENRPERYTYLGYKSNKEPELELNEYYSFDCMLFNKSHYDENGLPVQNQYEVYQIEDRTYQRYYSELLAVQYKRTNPPLTTKQIVEKVQETKTGQETAQQPVQQTTQPIQSRFSRRR